MQNAKLTINICEAGLLSRHTVPLQDKRDFVSVSTLNSQLSTLTKHSTLKKSASIPIKQRDEATLHGTTLIECIMHPTLYFNAAIRAFADS